jgi:hypothetical protein
MNAAQIMAASAALRRQVYQTARSNRAVSAIARYETFILVVKTWPFFLDESGLGMSWWVARDSFRNQGWGISFAGREYERPPSSNARSNYAAESAASTAEGKMALTSPSIRNETDGSPSCSVTPRLMMM